MRCTRHVYGYIGVALAIAMRLQAGASRGGAAQKKRAGSGVMEQHFPIIGGRIDFHHAMRFSCVDDSRKAVSAPLWQTAADCLTQIIVHS